MGPGACGAAAGLADTPESRLASDCPGWAVGAGNE
jgi:hypothetical protein